MITLLNEFSLTTRINDRQERGLQLYDLLTSNNYCVVPHYTINLNVISYLLSEPFRHYASPYLFCCFKAIHTCQYMQYDVSIFILHNTLIVENS
jgi:hypothetical protein